MAALDDVAGLDRVEAVVAPLPGGTDAGSVTSEGDAAHRGPQARALGPTGAGITMGVISDSIDQVGSGVSGSQSSGDLPSNVTVLKDETGGTDEGRAMAEIIYDGAPGIPRIVFASGTGDGLSAIGPVGKADSINQLVANGARIIADDIFYLDEPFFQDGVVTQAVDNARAAGVSYFASAGNRARQSWEGTYTSNGGTTGVDEFHNFGGGDEIQRLATVPNGSRITISFQWDEPFGGATTDLDLFLYQDDGSPFPFPGGSSESDNLASGIPAESISWLNTTGFAQPVGLAILRFAGTRSPFIKYIGRSPMPAEHITSSDTINPDAASALGALTVAAIVYNEPGLNDPESFSSRGPKTRLFDSAGNRLAAPEVRQKPTIAAADGVSTTLPPGGLNPFFGTSAATPSAAAHRRPDPLGQADQHRR